MVLPKTISLEDLENLPDDSLSVEEKVLSELSTLRFLLPFLSILSTTDKIIVLMLFAGFKQVDAAYVLGVTQGYVSRRVKEIRLLSKVLWRNPI